MGIETRAYDNSSRAIPHSTSSTLAACLTLPQRKHHNSTIPVSNLPAEILHKIFLLCQAGCDVEDPSWINVTYVCSFWREVALSCQELWNSISFASEKWTRITLDRSSGPLTVRAVVNPRNLLSIRNVLGDMKNIRVVALQSIPYDLAALQETLELPAPELESLFITNFPNKGGSNMALPISRAVPSRPKLRSLNLHGCPVEWLSPQFTSLTQLTICRVPQTQKTSFESVYLTLTKLTALEDLVLFDAFAPSGLSLSDQSDRRATLPNLKTVSIGASILDCASIISLMKPSPAARIHCVVSSCTNFDDEMPRLAAVLGNHFRSLEASVNIRRLNVTCNEQHYRFRDGFDRRNPSFRHVLQIIAYLDAVICQPPPLLDLTLCGPMMKSDKNLIKGLELVCKELPLSELEALRLKDAYAVTEKSWPSMLEPLNRLKLLSMYGQPPSGLMWTLFQNASAQGGRLLLPRLKTIRIVAVDCSATGYMLDPSSEFPVHHYREVDMVMFLEILGAYLDARKGKNNSALTLQFKNCVGIPEVEFERIKATCAAVLWDERGLRKATIGPAMPSFRRVFEEPFVSRFRPHHRETELKRSPGQL